MLRAEQNELVTRTGPGTAMGQIFRSYWIPALLAEELAENDGAPVRVQLLSEKLVAFRDTNGNLGLIDEFCAHRGVSLWFGRNEKCGLRCPYHGWKYNVNGECLDVPSESEESGFRKKIKLKSYPLVERGGILWTYMGPPELQPELPEWEFIMVPANQTYSSKRLQENNWLQAMEGGIDSAHVSFLHRGNLNSDPLFKNTKGNQYSLNDAKPHFEVIEHPAGLFIGARRQAEPGNYYWRITPWVMPCFTMVPPRGDHPIHGHFWIPIDDEHCWAWSFDYHPTRQLSDLEVAAMKDGKGVHVKCAPGTYRPLANKDNDYLMNRAAQKAGISYSGVEGIGMQDASLQESMGPIVDRTRENLTTTDNGIIMARLKLIRAAKALSEKGQLPPGRSRQDQQVRSAAVVLASDKAFMDGGDNYLKVNPGKKFASV